MSAAPANGIGVDERLMRRRSGLAVALGLTALLIVGRAVQLQGFQGDRWRAEAERQQQTRVPLPARRGAIYDRDGVALALTRETFAVSVAPREVRDRDDAVLRLIRALGLPRAEARKATDPRRAWVVLPGRFTVEQRRGLGELRGFYVERRLERFYPQGDVGREVLGGVSADGRAMGGIEQAMDSLLRGTDGFSVLRRDAHGRKEATLSLPALPPRDGDDVVLSIDFDLQEIADAALAEQVRATHAAGGDLILTDPRTGEILAAVSRRPGSHELSAFIEPYEPGSTLKPFFVAGLLANGRAALTDRIFAENGSWTMPEGRTVTDVHPYEWLTLRDGLRVSSNITMAKFSSKLPPAEQYGALRDFGFGTATGVEYPVEASGRLARPARWSPVTPASLAMGYEVSVTPLQMAMAYGAIANGGMLMEPRLVREVRAEGGTIERRAPRPVRRAIPAQVAAALRDVLVDVVADGTGTHASLATFEVAGKTGTSRRTGAGGRYIDGEYNSTFVGFFPAQSPQLVIYVKLDRPQGDYYGGLTAAPVTRATLQAILAARSPTLDRRALLGSRTHPEPTPAALAAAADAPAAEGREGTYVFLDDRAPAARPRPDAGPVPVPALAGLALRDGARRLHALGFHVRLQGGGTVKGTLPAAGAILARGDTLTLVGEGS
ncbi:cell division protein FtsI (penicillin-binding protein 3) [bacterium JGI 053]|nr:cell division protein FtsI (penicillin-binding protein 3) [bacterium JGI 053]